MPHNIPEDQRPQCISNIQNVCVLLGVPNDWIEFRIAVIGGIVAAHYSVVSVCVTALHGTHLDNFSYYGKFGESVLACNSEAHST
jgi:hypothetical protein